MAGVATGDMGIGKDGQQKSGFTRGMELRAKYTLLAEGARGSLSKTLIARFGLAQDRQPQKYGIGLKELWQVTPENFQSGLVQHTMGWPLGDSVGGGSFLYHFGDHLVSVGFVVHLNYDNPTSRRSKSFSVSRRIRWFAALSPAADAFATARARSPKAAGSRCLSSSSRAAR